MLILVAPAASPKFANFEPSSIVPEKAPGLARQGTPEQMIVSAIDAIRSGQMNNARATVDALLKKEPNYRLAHLLSADLYAMRAMPLERIGGGVSAPADRLEDLRREALVRNQRETAPPPVDKLPAPLLILSPKQKYVVLVDAGSSRIYVYENEQGMPRYVTDYYATIGKFGMGKQTEGDQRTPLGVYFVTSHMPRAQMDKTMGEKAALFGIGAWPISYPNEWDKREGRTGHGIWLHGVPYDTYARAPWASNGCVALTNPEMLEVANYLQIGVTPVVIVPRIEWLATDSWRARHQEAMQAVEDWRTAWEKLNTRRYLDEYSPRFVSEDGSNFDKWASQKTGVNAGKQWAKVKLDDLSLFVTGTDDKRMWVTTFDQDYRSNNLNNHMRKRMYWEHDGRGWKIVWEGTANSG
ncbi:L,D-transpeptidase family protein [Andreprevotia chitinilytica]|uniref:L,D-transpeptidase family protein n=1 Tax=Andreprevotia chitinilytica TaxID=396808 RepID=UPI0014702AFD|nr:L,D-transpeptidase family protein [Andreprevotia chitinilytica]